MKRKVKIGFWVAIFALAFSISCSTLSEVGYEIKASEAITVEIENGESKLIKFCPIVSGTYKIESLSLYDLSCYVYDENFNEFAFDEDGGDTSNFGIVVELKQNESCYISIHALVSESLKAQVLVTLVEADPSHVHSYSVVSSKKPTCVSEGEEVYKCFCTASYTKVIAKTNHNYVYTTTAPTCTAKGQERAVCKVCSDVKTVSLAALGHQYSSSFTTDKEATCTAKGSKSKHCVRCGKKNEVTDIAKKGHSYSSKWTIDKKSTLSAAGSKSHHCSRCTAKTDVTAIPKIYSVSLSKSQYVYNSNEKKPSVTIKDSKGNKLKNKTDYVLTYPKNLKSIGAHKIKITFKGNYSGSKTVTYKILPNNITSASFKATKTTLTMSWKAVKGAAKYRIYSYNTKTKKYKKIAETKKTSYKIKDLKAGTVYIYSVRAFKTADSKDYLSAQYTNFKASTIPDKPKLSAKAKGRKAVLSWKKVNCAGFEIYMKKGKNGSFEKVKTIKDGSVKKYTKGNLARGSTYYFKVRAFQKVGSKTVYSPFSKTVSVKIK